MNRKFSVAVFAMVLWGSLMLAPVVRGQDPSPSTLTNETLKTMLDGLGYEPKPLSKGFLIQPKEDSWTVNMQIVLSSDGTKIGMNANLGTVPDPSTVTAAQWLALLQLNGDIDPSAFYFDKEQKKLYLHRVMDNRAVTPAIMRKNIDTFAGHVRTTSNAWSFTK